MTVALEILSDPICPWCLIGKTRLDRALAERPEHPFHFMWRPFQLNPDMPAEGMDRRDYLERKFGGPERAASVYGAIEEAAEAEGLGVRFDKIKRTPSTLDAHRLIAWTRDEALVDDRDAAQHRLMDALFEQYFRQGADISDHAVLVEAAEAAGLDGVAVAALLDSNDRRAEIMAEDKAAKEAGVRAAPTFIIDHRYVVAGAQPTELWWDVVDEITAKLGA